MPSGWGATSVRRRSAVFLWRAPGTTFSDKTNLLFLLWRLSVFAARLELGREEAALRSSSNLQRRMCHHDLSECVLLQRKLRRSEGANAVRFQNAKSLVELYIFLTLTSVNREFARSIKRPFNVRYNPYTQTVDILHNPQQIANVVNELKGELCLVTEALRKIRSGDENNHPDPHHPNGVA